MRWTVAAAILIAMNVVAWCGDNPTIEYSWKGITPCKTLSDSPAFKFTNVPRETKRVRLFLTEGSREMGGQEVLLPESGSLPVGTARTYSPCNPGYYRWTAVFKSATGQVLGQVHQSRFYPTDEVLPEK